MVTHNHADRVAMVAGGISWWKWDPEEVCCLITCLIFEERKNREMIDFPILDALML